MRAIVRDRNRGAALRLGALLILVLPMWLIGAPPAPAAGGDETRALADSAWPMFQHDPQHTGRSPAAAPSTLALRWRFQVRGLPGSPAIGADGTIYLPSGNTVAGSANDMEGFLYAVNPDGTQRWRFAFPAASGCVIVPTYTTPAVATDGTIYVHTQSGKTLSGPGTCTAGPSFLYAINPDGSLKWEYQLNGGAAVFSGTDLSSPAIGGDGTIYVTSADTGLYAINPNGTLKWAVSPEATSIGSSPAIGPDGTIYVNIFDLHAYSPAGAHLWAADTGDGAPNGNSPSVGADGTIYACGINPDRCHAVSPGGAINWSVPLDVRTTTPALSAAGTILFVGRTSGLHALNPDGSERFHALFDDTSGGVSHSPVLGGDGRIYARDDADSSQTFSGVIHVLDADGVESDAEPIPNNFPRGPGTGELSPAIGADGTVYMPEPHNGFDPYNPDDQYLAAFAQGSAPPPPGPTPVDLELSGKKKQKLDGAVKVKASCDQDCSAKATGKLVVESKRKRELAATRKFALKKVVKAIGAGETETLKLKIPKKAGKAAESALEGRGEVKAKLKVEAIDGDGDSATAKRKVTLKR